MSDRKQNASNVHKPDSEFDRELAMVSRAYRGAGVDSDGPPAAMDDAIRAAARRAVKSGPHSAGKSWVSRWYAPLSAAALVVLTTSVGFLALDEQPELAPAVPREVLSKSKPSTSAAVAPLSAPASSPPVVAQSPAALPPPPAKEKKALAEDRNVAPRDQPAQFPKPTPERNRSEATVVAQSKVLAEESRRETVVKEAPGFVADPLATGALAANKETAAASASLAKRETAQDGRSLGLQASAGATARADAAPPAQAVKAQANATAPVTIVSRTAAAPPVYAPPAPAAQAVYAAPVAPVAPATLSDKAIEPADAWIKRLLELKKQGKAGEFEDALAKFRRQYPNFKLPDELKADK